jgi:hypothetical protein
MSRHEPIWECYRLPGSSSPDEWRKLLEQSLERDSCPYRYDIRNTSLRVWNPSEREITVPGSNSTCRNGYELQRVSFGIHQDETFIGISLSRLVFDPGSKFPTPYSADELFSKGKYPEVLRHQPMIAGIQPLIEFLNQTLVGKQLEPYKKYRVVSQAKNIVYCFGNSSESLAEIVQNPGLSKNLLNSVRSTEPLCTEST